MKPITVRSIRFFIAFLFFTIFTVFCFWKLYLILLKSTGRGCEVKKCDRLDFIHCLSYLYLRDPAALGSIPSYPTKNFIGKIINLAEVNQWGWFEENGQLLENVDQIHLVLASGMPVLLSFAWKKSKVKLMIWALVIFTTIVFCPKEKR